jgi:2-keto-3-deoxy-L-rhamnonate aldolase RhmA
VQVPHVNTRQEAEAPSRPASTLLEGPARHFQRRPDPPEYAIGGTTQDYVARRNANTLVCLMLEELEAIENISEIATVKGVDVLSLDRGTCRRRWVIPDSRLTPKVQAVWKEA